MRLLPPFFLLMLLSLRFPCGGGCCGGGDYGFHARVDASLLCAALQHHGVYRVLLIVIIIISISLALLSGVTLRPRTEPVPVTATTTSTIVVVVRVVGRGRHRGPTTLWCWLPSCRTLLWWLSLEFS